MTRALSLADTEFTQAWDCLVPSPQRKITDHRRKESQYILCAHAYARLRSGSVIRCWVNLKTSVICDHSRLFGSLGMFRGAGTRGSLRSIGNRNATDICAQWCRLHLTLRMSIRASLVRRPPLRAYPSAQGGDGDFYYVGPLASVEGGGGHGGCRARWSSSSCILVH